MNNIEKELLNVNEKIKSLKKKRKDLIVQIKNPLNTGYGIICGNSETPSLSLLTGYAVKCCLSEDSRYYLMESEASFLPDGIAVNCMVAIDEKTYNLIKPKNAVIESFLRNNFPDDFEF